MAATLDELKNIAMEIDALAFDSVSSYLQSVFARAKRGIPRYSYRKLADDLGFGSTNIVHLFIRGKRPISEKAVEKIATALTLDSKQRDYLLALVAVRKNTSPEAREQALDQLIDLKQKYAPSPIDRRHIEYASKWFHPVIREMVALPEFQSDPKWIASHIQPKISTSQARASLDLLVKIGFLETDPETGEYYQVDAQVATGPKMKQLYAASYHKESIPLAIDALVTTPGRERSVTSLTLSVSEEQFRRIKDKIAEFQAEIFTIENEREAGPPDRIVQLNMQLFPASKYTREKP